MTDTVDAAEAHVENMKKTVSLEELVTQKVTYPEDSVDVFLDGDSAYRVVHLVDEISNLEVRKAGLDEEDGSIAGNPEADEVAEQIKTKTDELQAVLDKASQSMVTVTMQGIPSKIWRIIDEKARRMFPDDSKAPHNERMEQNIKRNEWVNIELVKVATKGIKAVDGTEVAHETITREAIEGLYNALYESEWRKLIDLKDQLTFASTLFDEVTASDADFTRAFSPDEETQDTQN